MIIEADIFGDSHEEIAASLEVSGRESVPISRGPNDRWHTGVVFPENARRNSPLPPGGISGRHGLTTSGESILRVIVNSGVQGLNQATAWFDSVTSIPSLNFTPVMTCARYSNPR